MARGMMHGSANGNASAAPRRAVLVTGGQGRIARACARLFAETADVVLVGRDTSEPAAATDGEPSVRTLTADLTAPGAPAKVVARTREILGGIDVLVNAAAVALPARLGEIDPGAARRQVAANVLAPLFLAQEAVRHMPDGGVIINVVTALPGHAWPGHSVFGATQAALGFLTRTWAVELGPRGIRTAAVAAPPDSFFSPDPPIRPEEIASWVVTAADRNAGFLTGATLCVDDGFSLGRPPRRADVPRPAGSA